METPKYMIDNNDGIPMIRFDELVRTLVLETERTLFPVYVERHCRKEGL